MTSNLTTILKAKISGEQHDIDSRETALKTTKGLLHHPKISWTNG